MERAQTEDERRYVQARAYDLLMGRRFGGKKMAEFLEPYWLLAKRNNEHIQAAKSFLTDAEQGCRTDGYHFVKLSRVRGKIGTFRVAELFDDGGALESGEGTYERVGIRFHDMNQAAFEATTGLPASWAESRAADGGEIRARVSYTLRTGSVVHHGTPEAPMVHEPIVGMAMKQYREFAPIAALIRKVHNWSGSAPEMSPIEEFYVTTARDIDMFGESLDEVFRAAANPDLNPHLAQMSQTGS